jgi:UDP-N-acetylmuramoyl-L-alanyl-D-glutamate--2,6-diaminopimelate ligase
MTAPGPRPGARVSSDPVASPSSPTAPLPRPGPSAPPTALSALAGSVPGAELRGEPATSVVEVAFDSREVVPGALFFCAPGSSADGHDFAASAVEAGAVALVVERWLNLDRPQIRVPSVRSAMGPMSAAVFGHPSRSMTMIGVTGTNGKTTTTYLLEAVCRADGRVPGVVGTTGARIAGAPVPLARTTPEAPDLHRLLAQMRDAGVDTVAMEVSSHALDQDRVGGVMYDVVAFTNLSRDHLDYHPSMEAYFEAKARLFLPERARRAVVNADDPWGRRLLSAPSIPTVSFAVDGEADVVAEGIDVTKDGLTFRVGATEIRSELRGRFNLANCLGAFVIARSLGIDDAVAARGIGDVGGVPGRVEPVDAGQNFLVVVDYAHTPDSIHHVLQAARPLTSGRLIVVFGCGGDRDRDKRPLMGAAATDNADLSVITSDNPRSEDPLAIIGEIEPGARQGAERSGSRYVVEPDRRAAITLAVKTAREGDTVIIAGKGHEPYQEMATGTVPFDDREVARAAIEARVKDR